MYNNTFPSQYYTLKIKTKKTAAQGRKRESRPTQVPQARAAEKGGRFGWLSPLPFLYNFIPFGRVYVVVLFAVFGQFRSFR
jgi:hypothetical protein